MKTNIEIDPAYEDLFLINHLAAHIYMTQRTCGDFMPRRGVV